MAERPPVPSVRAVMDREAEGLLFKQASHPDKRSPWSLEPAEPEERPATMPERLAEAVQSLVSPLTAETAA